MGVSAELRMPTHKGRIPGLTIVLAGCGDPCTNFLGSGAVGFSSFGVGCGRVTDVSSSPGSIWGVSDELRMPTHKGEGTSATHSLTGLGRPSTNFFGSGAVVFRGFGVRCGRVNLVSSSLGSILGSLPNYGCPPIRGRVAGLPIV